MKVNGKVIKDMALEYRNGLMERGMKAIGRIISLTVRVSSSTYLATSMMENGKTAKQMAMESTYMLMDQLKKDNG